MRVSLKTLAAALGMTLGLAVFASPGEARTVVYGGSGGVSIVSDNGYRHHGGYYRDRGFHDGRRGFYSGGPRYYRHGSFRRDRDFYRDRGYYGRRHHDWDRRYYDRRHYRGNGVVIRIR